VSGLGIFSVRVGGQRYHPAALLKLNAADSTALFRTLADEDVAGKLIFILRQYGGLASMTVAGTIGVGCLERVLDLVRDWATRSWTTHASYRDVPAHRPLSS
jgi:hypothetical protein